MVNHHVDGGESPVFRATQEHPDDSRSTYLTRRQRVMFAVMAIAVVVSAGGLFSMRFVRSPAQVAADAAIPPATTVTALVERRRLTAQQTMRGQVYPPVRYDITPVVSSTDITSLYISKEAVPVGQSVKSGDLLGEVSGRPLFILKGDVPGYRDLLLGSIGTDVTQLQKALRDLGYSRGSDKDGVLGTGTAKAVSAFYRDRSHTPLADIHAAATTPTTAQSGTAAPGSVVVPKGEFVFLPSCPATVLESTGKLGQLVPGVLLELITGKLVVTGQLNPFLQSQVRPGMKVALIDDTTGVKAQGTVSALGQPTTTAPSGTIVPIGGAASNGNSGGGQPGAGTVGTTGSSNVPSYVPVSINTDQPLPSSLNGKSVRIVIDTASSTGDILAVPVSAVVTTAGGTTTVTRVEPDGGETLVLVTTGMSADGMVEVRAAGAVELRAGDRVKVGR